MTVAALLVAEACNVGPILVTKAREFRRVFLTEVPEDLIAEGVEDEPALND